MKRYATLLLIFALYGCGGGTMTSSPAVVASTPADDNVVRQVTINADYRQGETSGEYLVDVTFRTTDGKEFRVEYCDTPIHLGDVVKLQEYGVGTTLIYVNDILVGNIIDWDATEREIAGR